MVLQKVNAEPEAYLTVDIETLILLSYYNVISTIEQKGEQLLVTHVMTIESLHTIEEIQFPHKKLTLCF